MCTTLKPTRIFLEGEVPRRGSSFGQLPGSPGDGGGLGGRKKSTFAGIPGGGGGGDDGTVSNRRRSSAFLDYEQTTKAFLDSQSKLGQTSRLLGELDQKFKELQGNYDVLSRRFAEVKSNALDCALQYCVEKSDDFKFLPKCDKDLLETECRVGRYSLLETVGKGQFSVVRIASRHQAPSSRRASTNVGSAKRGSVAGPGAAAVLTQDSPPRLAAKIMAKDSLTSIKAVLSIEKEIRALSSLPHHPNVVRFVEALHGQMSIYILTESFPRDLFDVITSHQRDLDPNIAAVLLKEAAQGLAHIHAHRMAHRDLKPENILVDVRHSHIELRICDFGLCAFLGELDSTLQDFAGSPGFFAPEVLLHSTYCSYRADIFSLGAIALELLVSQTFFQDKWMTGYGDEPRGSPKFGPILQENINVAHRDVQKHHTSEILDFLSSTLAMEPSARLLTKPLLQHPWLAGSSAYHACDVLNHKLVPRRVAPLPHGLPIVGGRVLGSFLGSQGGQAAVGKPRRQA